MKLKRTDCTLVDVRTWCDERKDTFTSDLLLDLLDLLEEKVTNKEDLPLAEIFAYKPHSKYKAYSEDELNVLPSETFQHELSRAFESIRKLRCEREEARSAVEIMYAVLMCERAERRVMIMNEVVPTILTIRTELSYQGYTRTTYPHWHYQLYQDLCHQALPNDIQTRLEHLVGTSGHWLHGYEQHYRTITETRWIEDYYKPWVRQGCPK